jgi:hypothetical protein
LSLILRVKWLRIFENRVPRKIFGPKGDEVIGDWNKLNNEKFMVYNPHQTLFG